MELRMAHMGLFAQMRGKADRKTLYRYASIAGALLLAVFVAAAVAVKHSAMKRAAVAARADLERVAALKAEYSGKKAMLDAVSSRVASAAEEPIALFEGLARRTGVKGSIASIRPLEERQMHGFVDKGLEVSLERVDLNNLVNLLYRLERGERLFVVRELSMKSRFDEPDLLDARLRLSLISR